MQHLLILLCSKYARPVTGHELHTTIICSAVRSLRDFPGLGTSRYKSTRVSACIVSFMSCNASASAQLRFLDYSLRFLSLIRTSAVPKTDMERLKNVLIMYD